MPKHVETLSVTVHPDGMVQISHVRPVRGGVDMGGDLWFERASVPWVVEALGACLRDERSTETDRGGDSLEVAPLGHEADPQVSLRNDRRAAPRAAFYYLVMGASAAAGLLDDLSALD